MKKKSLIGLLILALPFVVTAQPSKFSKELYINKTGDTLRYRMLFPDYNTHRSYPLVIFLHGSGERGSDNEAQLKWGVMNFSSDENMVKYPAFVIAPQCPANEWWSNFEEDTINHRLKIKPLPSKPLALVHELILYMENHFNIDKNRVYITGLSMGGYGTFDMITRYPDLFAAAVPVCGGGDTSQAGKFKNIPLWIFHGIEDSAVSPVFPVSMEQALLNAGAFPGCTIYPESGHFSWLAAYTDSMMFNWLFRQNKK